MTLTPQKMHHVKRILLVFNLVLTGAIHVFSGAIDLYERTVNKIEIIHMLLWEAAIRISYYTLKITGWKL